MAEAQTTSASPPKALVAKLIQKALAGQSKIIQAAKALIVMRSENRQIYNKLSIDTVNISPELYRIVK